MTRYHVADAGTLEAVRQAINSTKPATGARMVNGVLVPLSASAFAAECARIGIEPGQLVHTSRLVVSGADAVLELPETSHVDAALGTTVGGTPIPTAGSLAQVSRARDHSIFVTGIRDALDDRHADTEYANERAKVGSQHANQAAADAQARVAIILELQGQRANNAITRKEERDQQGGGGQGAQAIERAIGLGRR